ncbi:MAG: SDR family oxidoreductase, partial [Candidatus Thiodiazotropha sp.]
MKNLLVTGANGFVGGHLCRYMLTNGYQVRAALREHTPQWQVCEQTVVGAIDGATDWRAALKDMDA